MPSPLAAVAAMVQQEAASEPRSAGAERPLHAASEGQQSESSLSQSAHENDATAAQLPTPALEPSRPAQLPSSALEPSKPAQLPRSALEPRPAQLPKPALEPRPAQLPRTALEAKPSLDAPPP